MIQEFDIYVYNRDVELLGIIDFFQSLRWRRKYYESGEFELHIPLDSRNFKYMIKDNLIIREDSIEVGIVESFTINDSGDNGVEIVLFGRFLSSILERRIIKNKIIHCIPYLMYRLYLSKKRPNAPHFISPFSKTKIPSNAQEMPSITSIR